SVRSSGIAGVLARRRASEERAERRRGELALEEDGGDLFADRQRDAVALRERERGAHRSGTFRDHLRLALDALEDRAFRERDAEAPVAREAARAREHEIAHAGETGERRRLRAERHREARGLGEATGDERGARVRT